MMKAIIMAGGKGTRISDPSYPMPKVLREAAGKPLLAYVLQTIDDFKKDDITIIVGFMKEQVMQAFPDYRFAIQEQQLGTGHAVMCAIEADHLENYEGNVIILSGDVPMISKKTICAMSALHLEQNNDCTMLTCVNEEDDALGRIIRQNGKVAGIVEAKDCTPEQRKITEKNAGLYIFNCQSLCRSIKNIKQSNKQGEYYLTDVPKLLIDEGKRVEAYITEDKKELMGVNTPEDLAQVEKILKGI
ncbi:MAG: NTP transferase domain-containing protein [Clostridiales bacterium]|nr:NTP transferase domain-containing protein [Clostridiales bacterium]